MALMLQIGPKRRLQYANSSADKSTGIPQSFTDFPGKFSVQHSQSTKTGGSVLEQRVSEGAGVRHCLQQPRAISYSVLEERPCKTRCVMGTGRCSKHLQSGYKQERCEGQRLAALLF